MELLKQILPTAKALEERIDMVMQDKLSVVLASTKRQRDKTIATFKYIVVSLLFLLATAAFLFFVSLQYGDGWFSGLLMIMALAWGIVLLVSGRSWFSSTKLLAQEMNMALVHVFSDVFGRTFLYTHNADDNSHAKRILEESKLITVDNVTVHADDAYQVFGEQTTEFHEVSVIKKVVDSSKNKKSSEVEIFRGLLVVAELAFTHDAETFVSTDGDRSGFAHLDFWSNLLGHNKVKETTLEWNDFEENLHVATTDPQVARQLLTPEFMLDLHDWWLEHKLNMRISFRGSHCYILMPEATIHISSSTTSTKLAVIKKYAISFARPIWRSLKLIEDVKGS